MRFVKASQKIPQSVSIDVQIMIIQEEKGQGPGHGRTFITVHEGMIL